MKHKSFLAFFLSGLLLLSGCTNTQQQSSETPVDTPQSNLPVEMPPEVTQGNYATWEYKRPNITKTLEMVAQNIKRVVDAAQWEEALECYIRGKQLLTEMEKMHNLALARYAGDTNSRIYRVELNYWNNHALDLQNSEAALERAVESSAHGKKIVETLSLRQQREGEQAKLLGYESRENALELESLRMEQGLLYLEKEASRLDKAWYALFSGGEYTPDPLLEQQVDTLLTVAALQRKTAGVLGFSSEVDRRYSQKGYSLSEAKTMLSHVKELFVPLYSHQTAREEISLSLDSKQLEERLYQLANTLSPSYKAMLSDCEESGTIYKNRGDRSLNLTQPQYITALHLPLISPQVKAHRISINQFGGSLANSLRSYTQNSQPLEYDNWLYKSCVYGGEVAMEQFYDLLFPQNAVQAKAYNRDNRLQELLLQGIIMELEWEVYGEQPLTKEKFEEKFQQLYLQYFKTQEGMDSARTVVVYRLLLEGNSSDTMIGLLVGMQLAQIGTQDPVQARKRLEMLFSAEGAGEVKEELERMSLYNPFRYAEVQALAYGYSSPKQESVAPPQSPEVEDAVPVPEKNNDA